MISALIIFKQKQNFCLSTITCNSFCRIKDTNYYKYYNQFQFYGKKYYS